MSTLPTIAPLDLTIVCTYVGALFLVGIIVGIRETADDFLVLSRRAGFFLILGSVVSSWVGVGMFVGTAASGYDTGISLGLTGACGALVAVIAAGLFAPRIKTFGDRYKAHTLGDFFRVRYAPVNGKAAGTIVLGVYLLLTAVQFTGLAALLQVWGGLGFGTAMLATGISTVIYTAFAGIKSDFYTDAIHFVVMVVVLFGLLLPRLWSAGDGLSAIKSLPASYLDPFAFGGPTYFLGGLVLGLGIVFVSMEIWQRVYASESARLARWALVGSAFIILPFYALASLVGLSARSLALPVGDSNLTVFVVMKQFLPTGLLGLGIAAFIALFVSSANTMMMVVSATITKDFSGHADRAEPLTGSALLRRGRVATLVAGIGGLLLSYLIRNIVTLSVVAIFGLLVLLPSVLGGFFWPKATARGSLWSMASGALTYLLALAPLGENAFAPALMIGTVVFVAVSLRSPHAPTETIIGRPDLNAR